VLQLKCKTDYVYSALRQNSEHVTEDNDVHFRVLALYGGQRSKTPAIDLLGLSMKASAVKERVPEYEAISYAWGSPTRSRRIKCNNGAKRKFSGSGLHSLAPKLHTSKAWLQVSETVYNLLTDLRPQTGYRLLWIDALCINQNDFAERACQVTLMNIIFAQASRVVVWLPHESDDADDAVKDSVMKLGEIAKVAQGEEDGKSKVRGLAHPNSLLYRLESELSNDSVNALMKMFSKPWFTRTWVRVPGKYHIREQH
jgi:hypothetical protein